VKSNILSSFTEEQQTSIYYDPYFGMSSIRNLTAWVSSTLNSTHSPLSPLRQEFQRLDQHWFSGNFQLASAEVELLTNSTSKLWSLLGEVNQTLMANSIVDNVQDINSQNLGTL